MVGSGGVVCDFRTCFIHTSGRKQHQGETDRRRRLERIGREGQVRRRNMTHGDVDAVIERAVQESVAVS
jgi:hypothetical protein